MDLHPTPFPGSGKRRPSANSTKKDSDRIKPTKQAPPSVTAAQTRPKRAFGVVRSTNIPIEKPASKPPPTKACKPWKPSGTSVNPGRRDAPAVATAEKALDSVSGSKSDHTTKSGSKKNHRVGFQEPAASAAAAADSIERSGQEDGARTPMSSIKPAVLGTPYHSAQNCSKCRLDRLESSSYWISQIKLAEAVGKHFVSAAFFRLALECRAQPFNSLRSELKNYVARHEAISAEILWGDLCRAYALSVGKSNADPSNLNRIDVSLAEQEGSEANNPDEVNCETLKDGSLECYGADSPHKELPAEEPMENVMDDSNSESKEDFDRKDNSTSEPKEDLDIKESAEARTTPPSCKESSLKDKTCGSVAISHGGGKKASHSNVSGKKSYGERSKRSPTLSSNDSSSNIKTCSSGESAGKGGETLNQLRPGSKLSGGKPTSRNGAGAGISQSGEPRIKGEADEKGSGTHLSENFNSDETGEDPIINESA